MDTIREHTWKEEEGLEIDEANSEKPYVNSQNLRTSLKLGNKD